jgi:hypothetical protein
MEKENLEYVGMSNCYLCNKPKEILLNRRLKKTFPKEAVYNKEPGDKCKDLMKQGIIFIGVRDGETDKENPYRSGEWFVLKEEAFKRMGLNDENLKADILKKRICFIEQGVLKRLGLMNMIKKKAKENKEE